MKFKAILFADVNMAHISQHDWQLLERMEDNSSKNLIVIAKYEEGVFLSISSEFSEADAIVADGFSEEFAALLKELQVKGLPYLRIDRDGYEVQDAPSFPW